MQRKNDDDVLRREVIETLSHSIMQKEEELREMQIKNGHLMNQLLDIEIQGGINKKFQAKFTTTFKDVHNVVV